MMKGVQMMGLAVGVVMLSFAAGAMIYVVIEELLPEATAKKFLVVRKEGARNVRREIEHYNLDAIIAVGYRVNSKKATRFRQWATKTLKEYIQKGNRP